MYLRKNRIDISRVLFVCKVLYLGGPPPPPAPEPTTPPPVVGAAPASAQGIVTATPADLTLTDDQYFKGVIQDVQVSSTFF